MSTHDLDLALQMSDRLWLLYNDHIKTGSPEDLLLQNAFQEMFSNKGIAFDNKTGMFKVRYEHQLTFPIKGHGFEYVLLRRALLRKGVKPVKMTADDDLFMAIKNDDEAPFELCFENIGVEQINSVELACQKILDALQQARVHSSIKTIDDHA